MFKCKSYVLRPDYNSDWPYHPIDSPEKCFIEVTDTEKLKAFRGKYDLDYIDGAICIKYNDEVLIDFEYYDLIPDLWSYILNMTEDYLKTGYGETDFPDTPVQLEFKRIKEGYMEYNLDNERIAILPEKEFFNMIVKESKLFFKNICKGVGLSEERYFGIFKGIEDIKKIMADKYR